MTDLILGIAALAAALVAVWNARETTRHAKRATHYARQARSANREAWGMLAETQLRQMKRRQRQH